MGEKSKLGFVGCQIVKSYISPSNFAWPRRWANADGAQTLTPGPWRREALHGCCTVLAWADDRRTNHSWNWKEANFSSKSRKVKRLDALQTHCGSSTPWFEENSKTTFQVAPEGGALECSSLVQGESLAMLSGEVCRGNCLDRRPMKGDFIWKIRWNQHNYTTSNSQVFIRIDGRLKPNTPILAAKLRVKLWLCARQLAVCRVQHMCLSRINSDSS